MKFEDNDANEVRRKYRIQAKQQIAEFALAGLRRPVYTGVFQRLKGSEIPTYICDLILDGYQRNLIIRLETPIPKNNQESLRRYVAKIQGLQLALTQKPFELVRHDPENGCTYLAGILDLNAAQLMMTVLFHCDADGEDLWMCVLQILQSET